MSTKPKPYGLGRSATKRRGPWPLLALILLFALAGMSVATQRVAVHYDCQPALGASLGRAWGITWYAPWKIFVWHERIADDSGFIRQSVTLGQVVFMLPLFLVVAALKRRTLSKGREDLHGSAHWATEADIRDMGLLGGQGVYVGGWLKPRPDRRARLLYLRHNGPEHVLVFAPTRSGKGVGLIIPTLLGWPESSLVFDIKGENWSLTAGWLASQGHRVLKFDPSDTTGANARFNPLEEIRLGTIHAVPDAQNLASMILDPHGKGLADYWHKAAFAFLSGALLHCLVTTRHAQGRHATLFDLATMLADEGRGIKGLFEEMLATDHAAMLQALFPGGDKSVDGAGIHAFIAAAARDMLNKADNELSGVVSTAVATLALYRDPVVARNTSRSDFHLADLTNHARPVNLYLVVSPADIDRLRPLVRILLNMLLSRATARLESSGESGGRRRLLLMLDEFTALGRLDIVERAVAYMAGYGLKGYFVVQDIAQLNAAYGRDNGLMANCHVRVAFAPNTIETARVLSAMTGKATVVERKTSLSGARSGGLGNASISVTETARPLLTEDECMRLPGPTKDATGRVLTPGDMLVFCAGRPPIYGRQMLYFLDPVFAARAKISAPGKSDSLHPETASQPRGKGYESFLADV